MRQIKIYATLTFLILLTTSITAGARPLIQKIQSEACDNPSTQVDMNICAAEEFKAADTKLNQVYNRHIKGLDPSHKEALQKAQRIWISYRDLACHSFSLSAEGGSMQGMLVNMCRTRLTSERTRLLNDQFAEG